MNMNHLQQAKQVRDRIYRSMTPAEKLAEATRLYWSSRRFKATSLRTLHPQWSDEEIQEEVRRVFMQART